MFTYILNDSRVSHDFTTEQPHIRASVILLLIQFWRVCLLKMFRRFWFCLCLWRLVGEY